jgi:hypothetical protein
MKIVTPEPDSKTVYFDQDRQLLVMHIDPRTNEIVMFSSAPDLHFTQEQIEKMIVDLQWFVAKARNTPLSLDDLEFKGRGYAKVWAPQEPRDREDEHDE